MSIGNNSVLLCETHILGRQTREWVTSATLCPALAVHGITFLGTSQAHQGFSFVRLRPRWNQLLVCLGGWGWVWLEGEWTRCAPGQAYLTPPGALHAYHADDLQQWDLCWIHSPESWLQISERPVLLSADYEPLQEAVAGLRRELTGPDAALLPSWAYLIYSYVNRIIRPNRDGDARLRRLWEIVASDLTRGWTVNALAGEIGLGGEHLRRLCRRHHAVTPMRQVAALRMRQASALLTSDAYTVAAVAERVGYDNPFAFSTAFKRHFGISPSEYRRPGHSQSKTIRV